MIDTSLFPHENHPFRLEFGEKKNSTTGMFSRKEHLEKYLTRYAMEEKKVKIDYRDEQPKKRTRKAKSKT